VLNAAERPSGASGRKQIYPGKTGVRSLSFFFSSFVLCGSISFHPPETPASTTIASAAVADDVTHSTKTNQARSSNERRRLLQINQ
jgi:hypothetical protein